MQRLKWYFCSFFFATLMAKAPYVFETSPLSEESRALAEKELRETPEIVKESLKELRELLKNDSSIHFGEDDDSLKTYLRPCKFYAKSAYDLMVRVANFKEKNKALLRDLVPEDEKSSFLDYNVLNMLKGRDHLGRRIMVVNAGASWDPSKVTSNQLFRIFYLLQEVLILEPETQVRGVVVIMDYKGLGMKQITALSSSFSMKLLNFIQEAMPLRLKEVHMVNQPSIFKIVWTIFKPFIKEKLSHRIFFHEDNMESLHEYIKPSHLPKNYGGDLPELDYSGADWYPAIESCTDHIRLMNTYGLVKK